MIDLSQNVLHSSTKMAYHKPVHSHEPIHSKAEKWAHARISQYDFVFLT